jgi:Zn2+/Cd2+-exporting ATPase
MAATTTSTARLVTRSTADRPSPRAVLTRLFRTFGLAIAAVMTWVLLVTAVLVDHRTPAPHEAVLALYVGAYLAGGTLATIGALSDLRSRTVNIDLLMVTAAIGAATLGAWAEGAVLLGLFSTSNALEYYALRRTRNAVRALMDLSPREASVLRDGIERRVPVEELAVSDVIVVRPGERIPADATLLTGATEVDQAAITGESMPVGKVIGDDVFAGTVNQSGAFTARVTHPSTETAIARIARLVEEAQSQKSRAERFTDRFESPYAIGVIAASLLVFLGMAAFGVAFDDAFYRAMTLLVVASPCALVISTPAATLSAIANAARHGVLVKGGSSLDQLGVIDTIAFDKTGTLTQGRPAVTCVQAAPGHTQDEVLALAASAEHLSEHPIARAIVRAATDRSLPLNGANGFDSDAGLGVVATIDGVATLVGNEGLFAREHVAIPDRLREIQEAMHADGQTAVIVGTKAGAIGVIAVADQLRPDVASALAALRQSGVHRVVMLTGDNERVAHAIAHRLGIDEVHANLMPEQKLAKIDELRRHGRVAMVGDGVNDAPALARADLGVGMGSGGTDVALETADVVLITGDLGRLAHAVALGRRMRSVIRASISFALAVIAVLVLSTLVRGIPLPLGVVGHEGSTIVVVLAGLTLLAYRGPAAQPKRSPTA